MDFKTKTLDVEYLDEISHHFSEHEDMNETLDQYARGQISEGQFMDQMRWMKHRAQERAWKKVSDPDRESDLGDCRRKEEQEDEHANNPGAA